MDHRIRFVDSEEMPHNVTVRRQQEMVTCNTKSLHFEKLQRRKAKSKSLTMDDLHFPMYPQEMQPGSTYLRHFKNAEDINNDPNKGKTPLDFLETQNASSYLRHSKNARGNDDQNRSRKSQSLNMDVVETLLDFSEKQQVSTYVAPKPTGRHQCLKETNIIATMNKSIPKDHHEDTCSLSSGFSTEDQETSDYGTLEKKSKANEAHGRLFPLKGDPICKDSQPVACYGKETISRQPSESVISNNRFPFKLNTISYIKGGACTPYKMDHLKRGSCIIFNVAKVEGISRDGSYVDVMKLKQTFIFLGFIVNVIDNPSKSIINATLEKYTAVDHSQDDCFACVILSHGYEGHIRSTNNEDVSLEEMMKTIKECRSLAGKPKLFFVQACRGPNTKHNYVTDAVSDLYSTNIAKLSSHFDVLVSYSTIKDYVSYRDVQQGSVYISILCDVLHEDGLELTLPEMLEKVNLNASTIVGVLNTDSDMSDIAQVPMYTSTLRRPLKFTKRKKPIHVKTIVTYDDGSTEDYVDANYISPTWDGTDLV